MAAAQVPLRQRLASFNKGGSFAADTPVMRVMLDQGLEMHEKAERVRQLAEDGEDLDFSFKITATSRSALGEMVYMVCYPNLLALSTHFGMLAFVQLALKRGCDVNRPFIPDGETPILLLLTEYMGHPDDRLPVLRALLDGGADPNRPDHKGRTPMSLVSDPEEKKLLMEYGAS